MDESSVGDVLADQIIRTEAARGERAIGWVRGALWILMGILMVTRVLPLWRVLGAPFTVALGSTLLAVGGASLVYARWVNPARYRPAFTYATAMLDLLVTSTIPVATAIAGGPMGVTSQLLGTTPAMLGIAFMLATVGLRQNPRASWMAAAYAVTLGGVGTVLAIAIGDPSTVPELLRPGLSPGMWIVRAGFLGAIGALGAVAAGNARGMVHRAARATADRAHVMHVFGRYVAPEVRDAVVRGESSAELRDVTVLFTDLRDFTSLSEKVSPSDLLALLNLHFGVLVPVVHTHGGTVNKFVGDALMATFGAPIKLEHHARAASLAAVEMVDAMAALNERLSAESRPALRMGIGIATGPVVVEIYCRTFAAENVHRGG